MGELVCVNLIIQRQANVGIEWRKWEGRRKSNIGYREETTERRYGGV